MLTARAEDVVEDHAVALDCSILPTFSSPILCVRRNPFARRPQYFNISQPK